MKFGTLQSISKETDNNKAPFGRNDDERDNVSDFNFDDDANATDDFDFEATGSETDDMGDFDLDEMPPEEEGNPVITKLLSLKAEIDDILSDMGYDDESNSFDEFDDESDSFDEFDFDDENQENQEDSFSFDDESEQGNGEQDFFANQQLTGDEPVGQESPNDEQEFGMDDDMPEEDENFQGNIRTVSGADLVYKRKDEDGNYEELWIYNVGHDIRQETSTRRAILAGTDIAPSQRESEDGTQHAETTTMGNVQYLKLTGLPN